MGWTGPLPARRPQNWVEALEKAEQDALSPDEKRGQTRSDESRRTGLKKALLFGRVTAPSRTWTESAVTTPALALTFW